MELTIQPSDYMLIKNPETTSLIYFVIDMEQKRLTETKQNKNFLKHLGKSGNDFMKSN